MKGVYELRTPLPRYQQFGDVSVVLTHFSDQVENALMILKELSVKLCALLLLSTAQRLQTIHLIKLRNVRMHKSGCTILILDKLKTSRPGFHQGVVELPKFDDRPKLCVVQCLHEYIERTEGLRSESTDKLLLCYQRPHGPATKDTIARWMKTLLFDLGIKDFGSHSFRGASSSAMLHSGVPLDDILKTAGWTNARTFQRFYNRPDKPERNHNSILNYYQECVPKKQRQFWVMHCLLICSLVWQIREMFCWSISSLMIFLN